MQRLYYNGRFRTLDPALPVAEALLVDGETIRAAGALADCAHAAGPGCQRIDLQGRTVIPGLIDAHVHFSWFSFGLMQVNLEGVASLSEALERLRERAVLTPRGMWIRAQNADLNRWERWPNRNDLDGVAPGLPVVVTGKDYHTYWVNSTALQEAGITGETPNPPGGQILRDAHGEPIGILQENAMELIRAVLPPQTEDEYVQAIRQGLAVAHQMGVTSVHDMDPVDCFRALQVLESRGELSLRFFKQIPESSLRGAVEAGLRTGFGNQWLRLGCLKLFADGSLGSQTAHMLAPFEGQPNYWGVATHTPEELAELIGMAVRHDIAVAVHAIGDAANRSVLNAFELLLPQSRQRGLRNRIEHAQLLAPEDIGRFAALDLIASVQPSHAPSDRYLADRYWGERSRYAYAFRSLLDAGARLAMGSDVPVEPLDPLAGIHAAVWRKRISEPESDSWYPQERLSLAEALRGFTIDAAYASGEERLKGSLAPGKLADFVVLSQDIAAGDEECLRTVRPLATVVGGRPVFGELW